jgi:hypothetical protein
MKGRQRFSLPGRKPLDNMAVLTESILYVTSMHILLPDGHCLYKMIAVDDFFGSHKINGHADIGLILSKRDKINNSNKMAIYINDLLCPYLDIFVRDDIAVLHYFSCDDESPSISQNGDSFNREYVDFFENIEGAVVGLPANAVSSIESAMNAIEEFIETGSKPLCMKWLAL